MKLSGLMKALLSLLATDLTEFRRAAPEKSSLLAWPGDAGEPRLEPSFRLTEVFSTLPPAQLPVWFKQRFASDPLFRLQEFQQLSPAQRQQMLVLIEKALDSRLFRGTESAALSDFLLEARRQGNRAAR
ncbi:MAG: hypothetical protein ACAI44_05825 [Candidatus Sericytochromatia bacterium]